MHERRVVVFSGGGTGGHLYPALALADALRGRRPEVEVHFVGAERGIERRILPERGEAHTLLRVEGIHRTRPWSSWRALPRLAGALLHTRGLFRRLRPEVVVVTGGYAGAPAGIVAGLMGIPLVLQEQNSVPGVSTRALSRWAESVHVAFGEATDRLPAGVRSRVRLSGNPVRPVSPRSRAEARAAFGLPEDAFVVLVTGGSQGSLALNRVMTALVRAVAEGELTADHRVRILWSTGTRHHDTVSEALADVEHGWVDAVAYLADMPSALAAADLAVSRAGAMATAEFLNQGLPAVLVPLPTAAADHQTHNAEALAAAGAAIVARESELTADSLWAEIGALAGDAERLQAMRAAARATARPQATAEIVAHIESLLDGAEAVA